MIVIEVGAHYSPELQNLIRDEENQCFFIEALPTHIQILTHRLKEKFGDAQNYKIVQGVLHTEGTVVELFYDAEQRSNRGASIYKNATIQHREKALHKDSIFVAAFTLKQLISRFNLASIDILRFSIQGSEFSVLENYEFRVRPRIIMVAPHQIEAAEKPDIKMRDILESKGYELLFAAGWSQKPEDQTEKDAYLRNLGIQDSTLRHSDMIFLDRGKEQVMNISLDEPSDDPYKNRD